MNRFFETVRYLSPRQIATRARFIAERALRRAVSPRPQPWQPPLPPTLTAPEASRLREFELHSFEWARPENLLEAAQSWIAAHPDRVGDAWHPYPTSLRIAVWCDAGLPELSASIAAQARFLATHLEYDVRGNHLLENARALIRAGVFLRDDALRALGVDVLREEVPEQILEGGAHFERTPGYHVRVLDVLADAAKYVDEPWLREAVRRMREFLAAIMGPNDRLPLLKDTTYSKSAPHPSPLPAKQGEGKVCDGFAVVRSEHDDFLIADFGPVCPDYLPAHAHADLFSFELTIGGVPRIVDSGVYEYAAGEWRSYFRSTAAHNTVEVDGRNQSDVWSSFRVGRRARPRNVVWTEDENFVAIQGEHDGYAPAIHHRTILALRGARIWIVADRVSEPASHSARSFIHLHPDADPPHIAPFGASMAESEGWYSERFAEKRRNRVLVLESKSPAWFGYAIGAEPLTVTLREDGALDVASTAWQGTVRIAPASRPQLQRIR